MNFIGPILFLISAVLVTVQAVMGYRLIRLLNRKPLPLLDDADCPPVVAIMCLRGTDPFLPRSLDRLFHQEYPNFTVRVIVDTPEDPARQLVEDIVRQNDVPHVEILTLDKRDECCSAKMSSLLQATSDLPDDCAVVATFDGDAILHPTCLRELVTPLVRDGVTVTTGNRWFAPPLKLGAMGRFQWNLGCVPLMNAMGLPWGGCLAMHRRLVDDPELRDRYANAFAEDMLLGSYLRETGQTVQFVPQATIVNREDLSLGGLFNFLTRQMLCVRLHHQWWRRIVGHGMLLAGLTSLVCPLGLLFPVTRWWCLAALVLITVVMFVTMFLEGRAVRKLIAPRGERLIRFTPRMILLMMIAVPTTQLVVLAANLRAIFARSITWRGLTYQLGRCPIVHLVNEVTVAELGHEYSGIEEAWDEVDQSVESSGDVPTAPEALTT